MLSRGDSCLRPATLEPEQVWLYRAVRYPERWEHVSDLLPGKHADQTVFQAAGGWWMFTDELMLSIPVLLGSTREGRRSVHVARFILDAIRDRRGVRSELIDLTEFELPILRQRPQQTDRPPPGYESFRARIRESDGLLIVTPEYKGGIPGVLKNALDLLEPGIFRRKPIGIATVSAGGFGGINCLAQLRLVCLAMGGVPIPTTFPISEVDLAFDANGVATDPRLGARLAPLLDDLIWYVGATTRQRHLESGTAPVS